MSEVCVICESPIDLAQSIDAASIIASKFSRRKNADECKLSMHAC